MIYSAYLDLDLCKLGEEPNTLPPPAPECIPCKKGFYRESAFTVSCTACPTDTSTKNEGSDKKDLCIVRK